MQQIAACRHCPSPVADWAGGPSPGTPPPPHPASAHPSAFGTLQALVVQRRRQQQLEWAHWERQVEAQEAERHARRQLHYSPHQQGLQQQALQHRQQPPGAPSYYQLEQQQQPGRQQGSRQQMHSWAAQKLASSSDLSSQVPAPPAPPQASWEGARESTSGLSPQRQARWRQARREFQEANAEVEQQTQAERQQLSDLQVRGR